MQNAESIKNKFKKYCNQLEIYGQTEDIHSSAMAMLRRKARKQLAELMKQNVDTTSDINRLWIAGYYHPFQFYFREENKTIETTTLLTMFCGELQEMISLSDDKNAALWNLFIGDLHRYMPDGEVQKQLAVGYYTRAIHLDSQHGRAFHVLSTIITGLTPIQRLRLMILGQLSELPYKKSNELYEFLKTLQVSSDATEKLIADFVTWCLNEKSKKVDHQLNGLKLLQDFKKDIEKKPDSDWPMIMSSCRLASKLAMKKFGFGQFIHSFDAISTYYLTLYSNNMETKRLLTESISWIHDAGKIFGKSDSQKNETYFQSLSVFAKTKWNELNDLVMGHINNVFESEPFPTNYVPHVSIGLLVNGPMSEPTIEIISQQVNQLVCIKHPTMELINGRGNEGSLVRRINQPEQRRLDLPTAALVEKPDREDWKPVYVIMDFDTILNKTRIARKIWDINDFICILPSSTLEQLDQQKAKHKAVRPIIRTLMELQAEGKITLKKCEDEKQCTEQLVQSVRASSNDYKHIVAFLCQHPENQEKMEGVTFYNITQFYTMYSE